MDTNDRIKRYMDIMPEDVRIAPERIPEFFTAPASTVYHGNYEGGLFDHSLAMVESLVELTEKLGLKWEYTESPYVIGMYHDICKADQYKKSYEGYEYRNDGIIPGHGAKSVIILSQLGINLSDEEMTCILWHMGPYEKDTKLWSYYDRAIRLYPNVLYTHTPI